MTTRTEPTVGASTNEQSQGFLSNLFGGGKKVRAVNEILGTFHSIVDELKTAVTHHKEQQAAHDAEIKALQAKHEAAGAEIVGANAAIDNITALLTPKAV
jgi:outer membrane murein-binding lipoprotein Lpp